MGAGMTRSSAPELIVRRSSFSHDETLQRLAAAIDARGATLFAVIDDAKNAAQAGLELCRPASSFSAIRLWALH